MSGPTNYSRAEELVADLTRTDGSVAQVHATLAVADQLRALVELLTPAQVTVSDVLDSYEATLGKLKHSKETS